MPSFLQRFAARVIGVLSGFDRLRFRGTFRSLAYADGMAKFLGRSKVLLKDYKPFVESVTNQVKQDVARMAEAAQRPVVYLPSAAVSKEEKAQQIARADGVEQGLVCVLSTLETCRSYEIHRNASTKHLELAPAYRKCLHYYAYWIPPEGNGGRFAGDASGNLRFRPEGMRVKHWVNENSLKMYDKQGSVLRIETTINEPTDFRVFRATEGDEAGKPGWKPMRKGVADIHRRAEVSQQANQRYLEGLAAATATEPLSQLADPLCQPTTYHGRRARGLNPFTDADARWLQAVSQGEFLLHGFRNRDLQPLLYSQPTDDPQELRRRSAAITRQIRLLRAHGLIRKLPRQNRYRPTPTGQLAITALLAARKADTQTLTAAA